MSFTVEYESLISQIVEIELEMFRTVNSTVHSPCQDYLNTFRTMRWMHHSVLPQVILESYLEDLRLAKSSKRNFMTEKYARMENRIPPLKESPKLDEIVSIEMDWMRDIAERYPATFEQRGENFRTYIACELEMLSDKTLDLLHAAVCTAREQHRNLVEERYTNLFRKTGGMSLREREEMAAKNAADIVTDTVLGKVPGYTSGKVPGNISGKISDK